MRPVGDHREDPADEVAHRGRLVLPRVSPQDLLDAKLLPDLLDDPHYAVRPRVTDGHAVAGDAAVAHHAKDAAREPSQIIGIDLVGPTEVVDDLRHRMAALRVPNVLGKLVVADLAAVLVPALRDAQVHALSVPS